VTELPEIELDALGKAIRDLLLLGEIDGAMIDVAEAAAVIAAQHPPYSPRQIAALIVWEAKRYRVGLFLSRACPGDQ